MTGIERALAALNFEPTDRAPVAGGLLQNARYLAAKAGAAEFWDAPRQTLFEGFRRMGCDAILGPVMPKPPEETTRDAWGRETSFSISHAKPEIATPEGVAEYARSAPTVEQVRESFDFQGAYRDYLRVSVETQREAGDMLVIPHTLGYAPAFPTSDGVSTYEAFLMACALYPDDMARLFAAWGETARCRYETAAAAIREHDLPRIIWTGQDICDAKGPVLSPALLERLYFPVLSRAFEPLKQAGIRIVWHADANYRQIIPRMVELGVDGFQGLYETPDGVRLEDLARMRSRDGRPLILFGSVSTVWVLPHGGPDDVRREVERCIRAVGGQGGLLIAPSSSIGPEVPWENVDAMYERALEG